MANPGCGLGTSKREATAGFGGLHPELEELVQTQTHGRALKPSLHCNTLI